ncbi:hypothetical protein C8R46DRAFT_293064 [Mycena filopes]|nr:hypothetical protein C8R46DRAFT_293064 [Mycena filopes]
MLFSNLAAGLAFALSALSALWHEKAAVEPVPGQWRATTVALHRIARLKNATVDRVPLLHRQTRFKSTCGRACRLEKGPVFHPLGLIPASRMTLSIAPKATCAAPSVPSLPSVAAPSPIATAASISPLPTSPLVRSHILPSASLGLLAPLPTSNSTLRPQHIVRGRAPKALFVPQRTRSASELVSSESVVGVIVGLFALIAITLGFWRGSRRLRPALPQTLVAPDLPEAAQPPATGRLVVQPAAPAPVDLAALVGLQGPVWPVYAPLAPVPEAHAHDEHDEPGLPAAPVASNDNTPHTAATPGLAANAVGEHEVGGAQNGATGFAPGVDFGVEDVGLEAGVDEDADADAGVGTAVVVAVTEHREALGVEPQTLLFPPDAIAAELRSALDVTTGTIASPSPVAVTDCPDAKPALEANTGEDVEGPTFATPTAQRRPKMRTPAALPEAVTRFYTNVQSPPTPTPPSFGPSPSETAFWASPCTTPTPSRYTLDRVHTEGGVFRPLSPPTPCPPPFRRPVPTLLTTAPTPPASSLPPKRAYALPSAASTASSYRMRSLPGSGQPTTSHAGPSGQSEVARPSSSPSSVAVPTLATSMSASELRPVSATAHSSLLLRPPPRGGDLIAQRTVGSKRMVSAPIAGGERERQREHELGAAGGEGHGVGDERTKRAMLEEELRQRSPRTQAAVHRDLAYGTKFASNLEFSYALHRERGRLNPLAHSNGVGAVGHLRAGLGVEGGGEMGVNAEEEEEEENWPVVAKGEGRTASFI